MKDLYELLGSYGVYKVLQKDRRIQRNFDFN